MSEDRLSESPGGLAFACASRRYAEANRIARELDLADLETALVHVCEHSYEALLLVAKHIAKKDPHYFESDRLVLRQAWKAACRAQIWLGAQHLASINGRRCVDGIVLTPGDSEYEAIRSACRRRDIECARMIVDLLGADARVCDGGRLLVETCELGSGYELAFELTVNRRLPGSSASGAADDPRLHSALAAALAAGKMAAANWLAETAGGAQRGAEFVERVMAAADARGPIAADNGAKLFDARNLAVINALAQLDERWHDHIVAWLSNPMNWKTHCIGRSMIGTDVDLLLSHSDDQIKQIIDAVWHTAVINIEAQMSSPTTLADFQASIRASPVASPQASPLASPHASHPASPIDSPFASPLASAPASPLANPVASPQTIHPASPLASPPASPLASAPAIHPASPLASPQASPPASPSASDDDWWVYNRVPAPRSIAAACATNSPLHSAQHALEYIDLFARFCVDQKTYIDDITLLYHVFERVFDLRERVLVAIPSYKDELDQVMRARNMVTLPLLCEDAANHLQFIEWFVWRAGMSSEDIRLQPHAGGRPRRIALSSACESECDALVKYLIVAGKVNADAYDEVIRDIRDLAALNKKDKAAACYARSSLEVARQSDAQ